MTLEEFRKTKWQWTGHMRLGRGGHLKWWKCVDVKGLGMSIGRETARHPVRTKFALDDDTFDTPSAVVEAINRRELELAERKP